MKSSSLLAVTLALSVFSSGKSNGTDFSSFLSTNVSLAVVVDQDYMATRGENVLGHFKKILGDTIREYLKNGGLNVRYFTWSSVHLKKEFMAAITVANCENTWKLYESTQITSVLLISITDPNCPRLPLHRAIMVPVVTKGKEFPQMILDAKVQKALPWKTAVVLVDQSIIQENPLLIESVTYGNSRNYIDPLSIYFYELNDTISPRSLRKRSAIRQALEHFSRDSHLPNQFLVFSAFYEDIIEVANQLNMFHINNQWLFFVIDAMRSDEFSAEFVTQNLDEGANIAFFKNVTKADCVISLKCTLAEVSMAFVTSLSRSILEEQSIFGEISDEEWESIRFSKQEKQDEILRYVKDYLGQNNQCWSCSNWQIQTAITWGKSQEHKKNTFSALRDTRNKHFEFIEVGYWSPVLGLNTKEYIFPHINQRFRNITLDIVTVHNPPWQVLTKNSRGAITAHSGIVIEILKELSRMLNFTYKLHEAKSFDDEDLTSFNETDNLLGTLTYVIPYKVIEKIQGKQFFLAAVAATIDHSESRTFNYTFPISIQKYTFISRKPDEVSRIYLFTAPFSLETWGSLIGVIMIVPSILYAINYLVPKQSLRTKGLCSMKNCFWYTYGSLLQQGGIYLPKSDSGRILVSIWWIVVIVMVTTYCGNLVAFLTFPKYQPALEKLSQLFKQNKVNQFALRNGTFFQKYSLVSARSEIRRYMQLATIYSSPETEGLAAVEQGNRVNIDWRINLQLIIQHHFEKEKICKFILGEENFVDEPIGLILPTNSPYLHLINNQIVKLFQMGFIERWHQINLPPKDKCNSRRVMRQSMNHKVNSEDMQGCFLVLIFGFALAGLVILFECCYHRWHELGRTKIQLFST